MTEVLEILKYTLPSVVVLITAYLLVKRFIDNEERIRRAELDEINKKAVLPTRLQAYERAALFLERIAPDSLIMRSNKQGITAQKLQTELLSSIRTEYEHNVSQQIYMSSQVWATVKNARENVVKLINSAASKVESNAPAMDLASKILEMMLQAGTTPTASAMEAVKQETSRLF